MNAPSERNALLKAGAGLALVGALALSACAPDDDPAAFDESEPASAEEPTDEATDEEESEEEPEDEETDEDSESEAEPESEEDDAAADQDSGTEEDDSDAEDEESSAGDAASLLEEAQQTVTYPLPDVDGEMTMGLQDLTVTGEGMLLSVIFVPEYDDESEGALTMYELHGPDGGPGHNAFLLPTVSDRHNFKQYYVPTPNPSNRAQGWQGRSAEAWATQIEDFGLTSGEPFQFWAYFPAPEDDIDTADVAVVPGAAEFQDVEIDWAEFESDDFYGDSDGSDDESSNDDEPEEDESDE